jgi:pimeloyl-ACP methyl ester carboxylesterase
MSHRTLTHRQHDFDTVTRNGFCWLEANTSAKKSVIIIHGVTGGKDDMLPLAERYIALGYAVYCPDLTGHGGAAMIHVTKFDDLGQWFRDVVAEIGITPTIIISNSYSSGVVYNYVTQGFLPGKTRVILGCPTPTIALMSRALNRFGQIFPDRVAWYLYNVPLAQKLRIKVLYRGNDQQSYDWLVESEKRKHRYIAPNVSPILTNVLIRDNPFVGPALPEEVQRRMTLVLGERDNVVTPGARDFLIAKLPHATFVSAGPAGHIIHFEAIDSLVHPVDQ